MSRRAHIVYLIRQTAGGMQNHLLALTANFQQKYQITVITPPNKQLIKKLKQQNINFFEVNIDDRLHPIKDLISIYQLQKLLRKLKPDLIHIHGNKTALVGRLALLGQKAPPIVLTVHNFLIFQQAPFPLKQLAAAVERRLAKKTARIITVSHQLKEALIKDERLPANKIEVIHNGLNLRAWSELNKEACRQRLSLKPNDFVILAVGRLVDWKGHRYLIEAVNCLSADEQKNVKVFIAGDGPLRQKLEQLIAGLNLSAKIKLLGHVSKVQELMAAADLFVLPSVNEPFGLVLLEAMAAKLPIIATASGGVPEIITHKENGWLVKPAQPLALAEAIRRLKTDAHLRSKLIANGWQVVNSRFSLAEMVAKTERVYEACLS